MQLKPAIKKGLETFLGEVLKQNAKHNLTGAKTKKDFEFHIEDCVQATIQASDCLLYTSPSPRDDELSRMPSSA